jgi:membrane protein
LATAVDLKKKPGGGSGVAGEVGKVKRLIAALLAKKWVQHLKRAAARFGERLGSQFAAAITYFSFLALVPILMLAFSIGGFILSSQPDLLVQLQGKIAAQVPGSLKDPITEALNHAVSARYSVLSIGLVLALYSGIGWMGNVRQAIQAQWRPDFDEDQEVAQASFLGNLLRNLWMLIGLGLALVLSLALSSVASTLTDRALDLVGLGDVGWLNPLLTVVSLLLAIGADLLIFLWVYSVIPPKNMKVPRGALVRGATFAAVGFELLKFALTNGLSSLVSGGASGAVFGPIIGLLAFFNLVATLVLFVAAWTSTSDGGPTRKDPDDAEANTIQEPAVIVHEVVSRPKVGVLLGVGAVLGFGWSRRRR